MILKGKAKVIKFVKVSGNIFALLLLQSTEMVFNSHITSDNFLHCTSGLFFFLL